MIVAEKQFFHPPSDQVHGRYPPTSKTKLPLLRPTWAPLAEPASRRREQWHQSRRLSSRSFSTGSLSRCPSGISGGVTAPGVQVTAPACVQAWFPERQVGGLGSFLPIIARQRSSGSACPSRPSARCGPLNPSEAAEGSDVGIRAGDSLMSSSRPSTSPSSQRSQEAGDDDDLLLTRRTLKRRNTLADRLLEARLARTASTPTHKRLLLAGRSRSKGATSRFYTTYDKAQAAFINIAHSGELFVGAPLAEAFFLLDYAYPERPMLIESHRHCGGRQSLDCDDFAAIVWKFEELLRAKLMKVFDEHSIGGDHTFPASLLQRVLFQAGAPMMPGAADDFLDGVVDENNEAIADIDYMMFERFFEEAMSRACLSENEHDRLNTMYAKVEDDRGTVSEQELVDLLSWGDVIEQLVGGPEFLQRLAAEAVRRSQAGTIDLDLKGWIDAMEQPPSPTAAGGNRAAPRATGGAFLAASRVLHEKLLRKLQATMIDLKMPIGQGSRIRPAELIPLVEELGFYNAVDDSVYGYLKMCGMESLDQLSFDQVYRLVFRFVCSSGLTEEEVAEIARAFRKFDVDCSGTLEISELAQTIRWLGYQPSEYRIYAFVEEAGLSESTVLTLDQFIDIVSTFMRGSLHAVRKSFKGSSEVRLKDLGDLLGLVGYESTSAEVERLQHKAGGDPLRILDFAEFKRLERIHRKAIKAFMDENQGCTQFQMERNRRFFNEHAERSLTDGQEYISPKGMRYLLSSLFPDTALERQRHLRIAQLVREADSDGNGLFDWEEFTWLMRKVSEVLDRETLHRGLQLKKELGFTQEEAKQFRDLFSIADEDWSGKISFDELCKLFGNLVSMDEDAKSEIRERWIAIQPGGGDLDFWDFLTLMSKIQEENWRSIRHR